MERNADQLSDDQIDIAVAEARMLTASGRRHSLDEVLALFGYTREQLRENVESVPSADSDVRLDAIAKGADVRR